jgi:Flp pilus assembly protein TadG
MRLSPHTHDDRGVAAIEFVIVFPFLLLILFSIVVMGGYMSAKIRLTGAVRDAARAGALSYSYTPPSGITITQTGTCPPPSAPNYNTATIQVSGQTTFSETSIIGMGTQTIKEPTSGSVTVRCGG